jgi:hypothetical protein
MGPGISTLPLNAPVSPAPARFSYKIICARSG